MYYHEITKILFFFSQGNTCVDDSVKMYVLKFQKPRPSGLFQILLSGMLTRSQNYFTCFGTLQTAQTFELNSDIVDF